MQPSDNQACRRFNARPTAVAGAIAITTFIGWLTVGMGARSGAEAASPRDTPANRAAGGNAPHGAEGHTREATALRQAFQGPVDVFFDQAQMDAAKPGIAGGKFVDLVDVTGKELLRFDAGKEYWLVDPDTVLAYRITKPR